MTDPEEARRALEALNQTQVDMAAQPAPHWSWSLAYGGVCGLLVAGQGLPQPWAILSVGVGVSGLVLLIQRWKAEAGYWVNGMTPRRARWVAIGLAAVLMGLMAFNIWYSRAHGGWIAPVGTGVAGGVLAIIAGEIWMRVWRREIREGDE